jgi:quinol monooxygenase YgiN
MHIRVTRGRIDPSRADELNRIAEQTVQAGKQLPGCRGFQIAMDRASGRILAVSTWDNPDQAQAIGQLRAQAEAIGVQFEPPELYEVVAHA